MGDEDMAEQAARAEWAAWAAGRGQGVTSPVGNLALVTFQPLGGDAAAIPGLPAVAWRSADDVGAWVAPTGEGLEIATTDPEVWVPVTDAVFVDRLGASGLPLIRAGSRTADVFSLDGSDYELRLYDTASEKLSSFDRIDTYDFDPAWRVTGTLDAYSENAQVPWEFTRSTDTGHTKTVPGVIRARIGETDYEFSAFADGGHLVLVFADGTTGSESYAPGRFLRFAPPPSGSDGVELDFNRAFIPPCGFSDFYSCPIPPAQNRVSVPIRAGEQAVRWHDA